MFGVPKIQIARLCLKFTHFKSHLRLPGGNELIASPTIRSGVSSGVRTKRLTLTYWGRACVSAPTIIGWDNDLSPSRHQAIIWTNARILLIGPLGTNFQIHIFLLKKMPLKISSVKCRSFCLGLNFLNTGVKWLLLEHLLTNPSTSIYHVWTYFDILKCVQSCSGVQAMLLNRYEKRCSFDHYIEIAVKKAYSSDAGLDCVTCDKIMSI